MTLKHWLRVILVYFVCLDIHLMQFSGLFKIIQDYFPTMIGMLIARLLETVVNNNINPDQESPDV